MPLERRALGTSPRPQSHPFHCSLFVNLNAHSTVYNRSRCYWHDRAPRSTCWLAVCVMSTWLHRIHVLDACQTTLICRNVIIVSAHDV
jgi:hypothetical protein